MDADERLAELLLNGIYCNEIEAPKPEFRDQPARNPSSRAPMRRRSFAVIAARLAPPSAASRPSGLKI